jgi:hypothetical protein
MPLVEDGNPTVVANYNEHLRDCHFQDFDRIIDFDKKEKNLALKKYWDSEPASSAPHQPGLAVIGNAAQLSTSHDPSQYQAHGDGWL